MLWPRNSGYNIFRAYGCSLYNLPRDSMTHHFYLPFRVLVIAFALALFSPLLRAQETDVLISSEPTPGAQFNQHWPGVFERNGKIYVVWGEPRVDTVTNAAPIW